MNRFLAFALLICSTATAEEIPLKSIWSWGLPDTQKVTDIDPEVVKELKKSPQQDSMAAMIIAAGLGDKSHSYKFVRAMKALDGKPGFAVQGQGADALLNASSMPLDAIPDSLPAVNVSLVFCAPQCVDRVRIEKVVRTGNKIEIQYALKSKGGSFAVGNYFALIPLGELQPGKYEVDISSEQKSRRAARHVSKPFSFTVE